MVQDPETTEKEAKKKKIEDFVKIAVEFNQVDIATMRQKRKIITMTCLMT